VAARAGWRLSCRRLMIVCAHAPVSTLELAASVGPSREVAGRSAAWRGAGRPDPARGSRLRPLKREAARLATTLTLRAPPRRKKRG